MTKEQVKSATCSFFIHAIVILLLIQHQPNSLPVKPEMNSAIKSYLYVTPKVAYTNQQHSEAKKVNNVISQTFPKTQLKKEPKKTPSNKDKDKDKDKDKQNKSTVPVIANNPQLNSEKNTSNEKRPRAENTAPMKNTVSAAKSLAQLQKTITASIIAKGSSDYYEQSVTDKNKIDKSIASSMKKPEIPINKIDCSSNLNHGIAIISNYLGGTVKCKKNPDIDKFIDARLRSLGVMKDKK